MSTDKKQILVGGSGSGRSLSDTVTTQRIDVVIDFVEPGGSATVVSSADGINFGPYYGVPTATDSIRHGLDVARDTYIAVSYEDVANLNAWVMPYDIER